MAAPDNPNAAPHSGGSLPYLALVAGMMCIAWSALFVRWTDIPGPASAFYRVLIAAVILLPTWFLPTRLLPARFRKPPAQRISRATLAIIAMGGVFFGMDLALYNTSILQTSAANATLLGNNTPVFVGLITWLVFRRRPAAAFWIGLAMALSGTLIILWGDLARLARLGVGDAMALGASGCFAVYLIVTERVRSSTGTLAFLRVAIASSTIFLFVLNLAMGVSFVVPSGRTWAALLGLGLVSQLGGYLGLTYAMGHLPATATSVSLLAQAPLTAVLAALLLGEPLAATQIFGGALVLGGIGLANRKTRPAEPPEYEANSEASAAIAAAEADAGEGA
ncbi:MAG: DMT family transporter [Acidobacteriia bacterium]|nr:DMT family transporter [Terriglobia bacterium]